MFTDWQSFSIILVTGPQRSGTRIAARCIAADTGHTYIDEQSFGIHSKARFDALIATRKNVVIQCPGMAHIIQTYGARPDVLIVLMLRELHDIQASEERIDWQGNEHELGKYKQQAGRAAVFKYAYWLAHQRKKIKNWREIDYTTLVSHPLWIAPEQRQDFAADQWKP